MAHKPILAKVLDILEGSERQLLVQYIEAPSAYVKISNPTTKTMCTHGSVVTANEHGKMTLSVCFEITKHTGIFFNWGVNHVSVVLVQLSRMVD